MWTAVSGRPSSRAAADKAFARSNRQYLEQEAELVDFFEAEGPDVHTPDVAAFQASAQEQYLASELSASWPDGMLETINGL